MTEGVTGVLARFAATTPEASIPASARSLAISAISDGVGVLIAGARTQVGAAFRAHAARFGGTPEASVIPGTARLPAELAALVNGVSGHAMDFDDTTHPAHAHPTTVLFPSVFAAAQLSGATGRAMVTAYLVGFEVESALGRGLNLSHYAAGWHATATFGALGAAAAAGRILGMGPDQTRAALGIAASSAGGLRANFGSMTKPLHAGLAAEAGVRAALLARGGWTADADILASPNGFVAAFGGDGPIDLAAIPDGLGDRWTIEEPVGLALKRYPSCGATHPSLDAALALRPQIGNRSIRSIRVGTSRLSAAVLRGPRPQTSEAARFSLEYVLGTALTFGRLEPADLEPPRLGDPQVNDLAARITTVVDERVADSREYAAIVTVDLDDGAVLEQRVDVAEGKNSHPMSEDARWSKFRGCVGDDAERLWDVLQRLDSDPEGRVDLELALASIEP